MQCWNTSKSTQMADTTHPFRKRPWMKFWVADFANDVQLRECSAEATGVYIRIICLMHISDPYGTITVETTSPAPIDFAKRIFRHTPYEIAVIHRSINELISNGVLYIEGSRLCQKRMMTDYAYSKGQSDKGRTGLGYTHTLQGNPIGSTIDRSSSVSSSKEKNGVLKVENFDDLYRAFEDAVLAYPDTHRDPATEWEGFILVADQSEAVLLEPAIQAQKAWRETLPLDSKKRQWPNMSRWIAEKRWLIEIPKPERQITQY